MKLFARGHVLLYRGSGGRLGTTMQGRKIILLTTKGRKTGAPRTVPVLPFVDRDEMFVIGSMGGAPQHPAWFRNLEAHPNVEVQLGGERWRARAAIVGGAERESVWNRVVASMPDFAKYQQKTSRTIPVVRLSREP